MSTLENIEKLIKDFCETRNLSVTTSDEMDKKVLNDALSVYEKTKTEKKAEHQPIVWRMIMNKSISKIAAVAIIIMAVIIGLNGIGNPDMANAAWADVIKQINNVDYAHVYWLKSRGTDLKRHFEAWYDRPNMVIRGNKGEMTFDDGQTEQGFNENGKRITKGPSKFVQGQTFIEIFTAGLLSDKNEQFNQKIPVNVGDDFLIYEFAPPCDESEWGDDSEWIKKIVITVGYNSLLPIQMKIYEKESDDYDLVMFDYEADRKPASFFESLLVDAPNGQGKIVLDGEEAVINIEGALGLKQAIVRLHGKYDGPVAQLPLNYRRMLPVSFRKTYERKGGPIFKLDITFVTEEGYRSGKNDIIVLWLNETQKCGVGSRAGSLENWPDGKYRNIKFSPLLKSTDKQDTYIIEIMCWLKPKPD